MSGAAKRRLKKQQEKSITKLRKLNDLGFINIAAPTNMSESSATTTVDQSGDRACNELNSSNPEGMIPLEAEALSLGSHAESGHESKTMLMLVIQLKNVVVPNAVAPNPVAPCCQNIVAMLLCGRTFQKRCVNTGA